MVKAVRLAWIRKPVTKVKGSKKVYNRKVEKALDKSARL
jgi:hypothetical protein